MLTNAPILKIADPDKDFVVCTNLCKRGLGGVLMQEGWVVCYESTKLNEQEQNYVTHDLELEAIIHALNMWRHYLLGRKFVLMITHNRLRFLFDQLNLNVRYARWLATISEFEFEIRYVKGNENMVANALSRRVQMNHVVAVSSYGTDLKDQILQVDQHDDKYMEIRHMLQQGRSDQDTDYHLTTYGLVRFRVKIYFPYDNGLVNFILREFHVNPYSRYP